MNIFVLVCLNPSSDLCTELIYTERTHIRELRVMQLLFYQPLVNDTAMYRDFANLMFPSLDKVIRVHGWCLILVLFFIFKSEA